MELVIAILVTISCFLVLAGSLGVIRFEDLYMRMSASTKAGIFGVSLLTLSVGVGFGDLTLFTKSIALVVFLMFTAPIGSHVIARIAYLNGSPLAKSAIRDDLSKAIKSKKK